jgi:hypothetical protein
MNNAVLETDDLVKQNLLNILDELKTQVHLGKLIPPEIMPLS